MASNVSRAASPQPMTGKTKESTFVTGVEETGPGSAAWQKRLDEASKDLGKYISGMDTKISDLLVRQEQECLSAVALHWNRKHQQIVNLIEKIHAKHSNQSAKDERILALESKINFLSNEATRLSEALIKQKNETTRMKTKVDTLRDDSRFFEAQVKATKRHNKLLKLALAKATAKLAQLNAPAPSSELDRLHRLLAQAHDDPSNLENSLLEGGSLGQETVLEADSLLFPTEVGLESSPAQLPLTQGNSIKKEGIFRAIPTENVKLGVFLDTLFAVEGLTNEERRREILRFVENLETRYGEQLKRQTMVVARLEKKMRRLQASETDEVSRKNELEAVFVESVEEVRKEIMRRRMKNEVATKKKFRGFETKNAEEAAQFEQSLLKLANLAKKRVKLGDFTATDKFNILDLFVNNETTLLKLYESLFPHRASSLPTAAPEGPVSALSASARNFSAAAAQAALPPNPSSSELLAPTKSQLLEKQTSGYDPSSLSAGFLPAIQSKPNLPLPQHKQQSRSVSRPAHRVYTGRAPPTLNASMDAGFSNAIEADRMGIMGQRSPMVPRPDKVQKVIPKRGTHPTGNDDEECASVASSHPQQLGSSFQQP